MTKLITRNFNDHVSLQIKESFVESQNNVYYAIAGRHFAYANGDATIPTPSDSVQLTEIDVYSQGIFGKRLANSDVNRVASRHDWVSGTVYPSYSHTDTSLFTKAFYVVAEDGSNYNVYKVLDNNGGANSTIKPEDTDTSAASFTTSDGYVWKYMYTINSTLFAKFASDDFIPVFSNAEVVANAVSGAIDVIQITNAGSDYSSVLVGQFGVEDVRDSITSNSSFTSNNTTYRLNANAATNTNFYSGCSLYLTSGAGSGQIRTVESYFPANRVVIIDSAFDIAPDTSTQYLVTPSVTISGDGSDAKGYAVVNSNASVNNFIERIELINRGTNYTYATATIVGNTGGLQNTATVVPVISPVGGHGADPFSELGAKTLCINIEFDQGENGFVSVDNDYRFVGILKDPLYAKATMGLANIQGTFTAGETLSEIKFNTLTGYATVNSTSAEIEGTGTEYDESLSVGDYVYLRDETNNYQSIRQVEGVSNSTVITLSSNNSFACSFCKVAKATIVANAVINGFSTPNLNLSNVEPRFTLNSLVIGNGTGSIGRIDSIDVQEKSYNSWSTFDNRTRISYTANVGLMPEDTVLYQENLALSNGYFHSANDTYIFITEEKGPINADPSQLIFGNDTAFSFTPGSVKYTPDVVKGSGKILYLENFSPISRSSSQKETIKIYFDF